MHYKSINLMHNISEMKDGTLITTAMLKKHLTKSTSIYNKKTLNKVCVEETSQHSNSYTIANIILNDEKMKAFPLRSGIG